MSAIPTCCRRPPKDGRSASPPRCRRWDSPTRSALATTYFNEQIDNLIVTVFVPVETSQNIGSAHIQGVENELGLHPARWLRIDATYTYVQPENADTGEKLLRRPQNTASLDVTLTPVPKLTIVPELLYTGAFSDFLINNSGFSSTSARHFLAGTAVQSHRYLRCHAAHPALCHRPQPGRLAVRAGERVPDSRTQFPCRRAVPPVSAGACTSTLLWLLGRSYPVPDRPCDLIRPAPGTHCTSRAP